MKVVQVANFYGPRSGGLRTAIDELGAGYVRRGHDVALVVPAAQPSDRLLPSGVRRITVPAAQLPFTGGYRAARLQPVTDVLTDLAPDVIEVSDRLTLRRLGLWARRRGIASVMISHERLDRLLGQILPAPAARAAADIANKATARSYDTVVATTGFAREEFDRLGGVGNIALVPLGVDLDLFHPGRYRAEIRADRVERPSQLLAVHCGRLSVEKHVERSIDALAILQARGHDIRLAVAGDGPRRGRLRRRAAGLRVDFLGHLDDRAEVAALLACADIALAPGPHETFGLAALEALACGTAVVVSQSGALTEIVTSECGAAAPDTAQGFADAIDTVLQRSDTARSTAARDRAEQFSWPRAAEAMIKTWASSPGPQ